MCPEQVSKFLTKRNWMICICIAIALLGAVGIYFLVRGHKPACKIDHGIKTAEEYKNNFGNKLVDDISEKYLALVQTNYLKEKPFYESLLKGLRAGDSHHSEIQEILKKSNENFEKINPTKNNTDRVELIKLSKDLNAKFYALSNRNSLNLTADGFNKIRDKSGFHALEQSKNEELFKTVKAINENWRALYKCIPHRYFKAYPEFETIDKLFKEILTSNADKTTFKILSLFERIDGLFDQKIKVSQFDLGSASSPAQAISGPPQLNNPRGPPGLALFPPGLTATWDGVMSNVRSGVQAPIDAINNATSDIKNVTKAYIKEFPKIVVPTLNGN